METGHYDIDGNEICDGDVLAHANDAARTGLVVATARGYFIDCADDPSARHCSLSEAHEWRIIGRVQQRDIPSRPGAA